MTLRAVLFGLLGAVGICGFTYFNDAILRQTMFVGNHLPIGVYGPLLLFLLFLNPLLGWVHRRTRGVLAWLRPLTAAELSVVVALSLASCFVPYSSLMRLLGNVVMLPNHYVRTETSWRWTDDSGRTVDVLQYLPEAMKPDLTTRPGGFDPLDGFVQGLRSGDQPTRFRDVPWHAWVRPLGFWLPLTVVLCAALTGLSLAVHRQWARNEHLPYPVVSFTEALLPPVEGGTSPVLHNRLFWIGTVAVLLFHVNNYTYEWWPDYLFQLPRVLNFTPLGRLMPTFMRGGGWDLLNVKLYFSFIAIAFLLATDVSLGVAMGPFIFHYVAGVLLGYGINMETGTYFAPRIDRGIVYGGYVGVFVAILYSGRYHFGNLLRRAVGLRGTQAAATAEVWGTRVFLLGMAVFVLDLTLIGLDWQLAALYSLLTVVIFLVMGRIIAETGLFFIAPYLYPCALIYTLLGEKSVGPHALMIMFTLTCGYLVDPRETFMPYIVNGVKLADDCRSGLGRTATLCVAAVVLGLLVAVPLTLYFQYDRGANWNDYWASYMAPKFAATEVVRIRQRLIAQGTLEQAEAVSGWGCFASPQPDARGTIAFVVGLGGTLLCVAGRFRFPWWPLHPVVFLVWGGWAGYQTAWPFLLGGVLKMIVTKYGGAGAYQRLRPLMFGLIAGDMLSGVGITAFGLLYYLVTGDLPKPYLVLLG